MAKKDIIEPDETETSSPEISAADAGKAAYEEALAEATKQFDFVSQTGDRTLISKAAQRIADIKQHELERLEHLK